MFEISTLRLVKIKEFMRLIWERHPEPVRNPFAGILFLSFDYAFLLINNT